MRRTGSREGALGILQRGRQTDRSGAGSSLWLAFPLTPAPIPNRGPGAVGVPALHQCSLLPSRAGAPSPAARHLAAAKVHGPAKQIHRFPSHSLRARARDDRDVRDDRGLRDDRPHHRHVIPRRAFRRGIRLSGLRGCVRDQQIPCFPTHSLGAGARDDRDVRDDRGLRDDRPHLRPVIPRRAFRRGIRLSGLRGRVREKQTPRLHTHLVKAGAQSETELRGDRLLRADSIRRRELAYTGWVGVRNSEGISSLGSKAMASTFSRLNSMAGDSAVTLGKRMACICPKKKGMKI